MAAKPTGGPAFPRPASEDTEQGTLADGNRLVDAQAGMTLRDYFAARAMAALLGCPVATAVISTDVQYGGGRVPGCKSEKSFDAEIAKVAYEMADAMIAARSK